MEIISIILIAIGLSMDSFAVSVSNGLIINQLNVRKALTISFTFAIFQGVMPVVGWFIGIGIERYIKEIDHWVAFILLCIIGFKMLYDSRKPNDEIKVFTLKPIVLIAQSISTSIDAFVVGVGFALLGWAILTPALIIFITTLIFSLIGLQIGKYIGNKVGKSAIIIGGIVLIFIGTKILIEHLYF